MMQMVIGAARPGAASRRRWLGFLRLAVVAAALAGASCSNVISRKYEYEEDVYLRLDGSATIYVNAAVPALVALRDAPLPIDPAASAFTAGFSSDFTNFPEAASYVTSA